MERFKTLLTKEIKMYFISPLGYIFAVLFISITTWLFFQDFFVYNQAKLDLFFNLLPFFFLLFLPALTMNTIAEERKLGTWEILLTLPTNELMVVSAKLLSSLIFVAIVLLLSLSLVVTVGLIGHPDWGVIIASYLAAFLLAIAYLATGVFFSSLSRSSVVAFLGSMVFLLVNYLLSNNTFVSRLPPQFQNMSLNLSLAYHYQQLTNGVVAIADFVFFVSWVILFVWLTVVVLKSRDY